MHRFVKALADGTVVTGVAGHQVHKLRDGGFKGHIVSFQQVKIPLDPLPYLVNLHITAFVKHLGGDNGQLAVRSCWNICSGSTTA